MPTPIVHTAVGIAAGRLAGRPLKSKETGVLVFVSNLPDLDLIPGMIAGRPLRFHHLASHSIVFAAAMAALFSLAAWGDRRRWLARFNCLMPVCISHPLMDLVTADKYLHVTSDQLGLQLFWPFSPSLFGPYAHVFEGAYFTSSLRDWFILDNFKVFGFESLVAFLILALAYALTSPRSLPEGLPEQG